MHENLKQQRITPVLLLSDWDTPTSAFCALFTNNKQQTRIMKKPTLSSVIFSSNYVKDNIVVLMLSEATNSAFFNAGLDNTPYAYSARLPNMRDERDVQAWYEKLVDDDFNGLNFYEFAVSDLTNGAHKGIKTKNNVARVIRRATPKSRTDVENVLKAQFANATNIEWHDAD